MQKMDRSWHQKADSDEVIGFCQDETAVHEEVPIESFALTE